MTAEYKTQIQQALKEYCAQHPSQNAAANTLNKVSPATVSQILKGNWENISEKMWRSIAKQIGANKGWQYAETHISEKIAGFLEDAQQRSNVHAIIQREGGSKTETAKRYVTKNINVWRIGASQYFNRKTFLARILQSMGQENSGTVSEMVEQIVTTVERAEEPLLIIDEADKLNDQVLSFFITFYNELEGKCGIVIMGTDHLKKRIEKGVKLNKMGYKEIYSRIGRRFIEIPVTQEQLRTDIEAICKANGVIEPIRITEIINKSDGDFRRVRKLIEGLN